MLKRISLCWAAVIAASLLVACALGDTRPPAVQYDLGPLQTGHLEKLSANIPLVNARVQAPEWMSENLMVYRLDYVNDQQVRFYTESSWNTSPPRLFANRLEASLAVAGNAITGADSSLPAPTLRIYLEDFSQHFASPSESVGRIVLRASLFRGRELVAQKRFEKDIVSATADAPGGARALSQNSDELIAEIMNWLAEVNR